MGGNEGAVGLVKLVSYNKKAPTFFTPGLEI